MRLKLMSEKKDASTSPTTSSEPEPEVEGKESEKGQRKKRWATKVRTGCITCKTRRIKCDESKPICQRCKTSGYRCNGYKPPKSWMLDGQLEDNNSPQSPTGDIPALSYNEGDHSFQLLYSRKPHISSLTPYYGSSPETRSLQYFIESTASLFKHDSLNTRYWTVIVPNLSWVDDAIKHSISAISMMTEFAVNPKKSAPTLRQAALNHYGKALRLIGQYPHSPLIILIISELFWSMETMCMNFRNAEVHLTAMLRILNEWRSGRISGGTSEENALIRNCIAPCVEKMHIEGKMKPERMSSNWKEPTPVPQPDVGLQLKEEQSDSPSQVGDFPLATTTDTTTTFERDSRGLYGGETLPIDERSHPPTQPEVQSLLQNLLDRRTALVGKAYLD